MINTSANFDGTVKEVRKRLDGLLVTAPCPVRAYTAHLTKGHGKFIRARAVLACAMDEEGNIPEDAITFAVAIEMLHLATLVHDDIMDEANLRRGVETLQKKYGKRTAVICGDYLLTVAIRELSKAQEKDSYRRLDAFRYVGQICLGELRQNQNRNNYDLNMFRYLSIINGKTAALFEASYLAGALVREESEERLRLYRRLGRYTGVIFQLTDDCLDYELEERIAGKNVQSDYAQGVITLPVIHTFEQQPELKEKAREGWLFKNTLLTSVRRCEGVEFTHQTAEKYYEKAMKSLQALELPGQQDDLLKRILDKAYGV